MNAIQENINIYYFLNESNTNNRYFKQKMAMQIYNDMNFAGIVNIATTTLKEIWKEINNYFHRRNNPQHTCKQNIEIDYGYGQGRYMGD